MSSENRPGNPSANQCAKHGDFIGSACPVCAGVSRAGSDSSGPSKAAYRRRARAGLLPDEDWPEP